jgi:hypothetical protein
MYRFNGGKVSGVLSTVAAGLETDLFIVCFLLLRKMIEYHLKIGND